KHEAALTQVVADEIAPSLAKGDIAAQQKILAKLVASPAVYSARLTDPPGARRVRRVRNPRPRRRGRRPRRGARGDLALVRPRLDPGALSGGVRRALLRRDGPCPLH